MKLVIQIPCFNEAQNLPQTLKDLPKKIDGLDTVETLVIDDGSTDGTAKVAKECGVDHMIELKRNRGLATAFQIGIRNALALGADIVVNTDGDNQYDARDIPKLIKPILEGKAEFVVGCRPIRNHPEFSSLKKFLQRLGSWFLRRMSKTDVPDAASGFRAYSRETCLRLIIHSRFSHCMETLIQAGNTGIAVSWTNIRINPKTRSSRLFKSNAQYLLKSGETILTMSSLYAPGRFFSSLAFCFLVPAFVLGGRFLYLSLWGLREPGTHLPSLILFSIFSLTGLILMSLAFLGELLKTHRRLNEEILYEIKINSKALTISSSQKIFNRNE